MNDPIAFFITVSTYGTWLPGDQRGWVEYYNGWHLPDPVRVIEAKARMTEHAKLLTPQQRSLVEEHVRETCNYRQWICHAVNCRTNHMHTVISAPYTPPKKIRADLKAWCSKRLKTSTLPTVTDKWWAERGSIRWVFDEEALNRVIFYTVEGQDKASSF